MQNKRNRPAEIRVTSIFQPQGSASTSLFSWAQTTADIYQHLVSNLGTLPNAAWRNLSIADTGRQTGVGGGKS